MFNVTKKSIQWGGETLTLETGKVVVDGQVWDREDLEALAAANGLQPVGSVTKTCDLVVASDPATTSGKAQRARQLGLPVLSAADFLQRLT